MIDVSTHSITDNNEDMLKGDPVAELTKDWVETAYVRMGKENKSHGDTKKGHHSTEEK